MVYHDQYGIKSGRGGEVSDEVTGDLLERAGRGGRDGDKWRGHRVGVYLVLLANCTTFNILADEGSKSRPPKLSGDKLMGFQDARVSSSRVIMVFGDSQSTQVRLFGDIDTTLVGQDTPFVCPVNQLRLEWQGVTTVTTRDSCCPKTHANPSTGTRERTRASTVPPNRTPASERATRARSLLVLFFVKSTLALYLLYLDSSLSSCLIGIHMYPSALRPSHLTFYN